MAATGHVDTFCRDHLPPADQWPELLFDIDDVRYPPRLNCVTELLDHTAAERPCFLSPGGPVWTYGEVRGQVDRVARALLARGVRSGNRILLRGPNNPSMAICWLATLRIGAVAVATMPQLRANEISTIAAIAQVDLALCDDRFTDDLPAGRAARRTGRHLHRAGRGGGRAERRAAAVRGHRRRRRRAAGVHLRHHRPAQGDDAPAPRRAGHGRHRRQARVPARPRRRRHRHATAGVHVRARRAAGLPDARRRGDAAAGARHPGGAGRRDRAARCDRLLHRADGVQGDAGRRRGRSAARAAPGRLRGRAPAALDVAGVPRRRSACGSSTASAPPRCCTCSSPPPTTTSGRAPPAGPCPATARRSSTTTASRYPSARRAGWRSRARRAAATSPTSGSATTSGTAGTSPATSSSRTPTATSPTSPAATT